MCFCLAQPIMLASLCLGEGCRSSAGIAGWGIGAAHWALPGRMLCCWRGWNCWTKRHFEHGLCAFLVKDGGLEYFSSEAFSAACPSVHAVTSVIQASEKERNGGLCWQSPCEPLHPCTVLTMWREQLSAPEHQNRGSAQDHYLWLAVQVWVGPKTAVLCPGCRQTQGHFSVFSVIAAAGQGLQSIFVFSGTESQRAREIKIK